MKRHAIMTVALLVAIGAPAAEPAHDMVIYGGTSAAVVAAVQAATMGKSVIIVSPDKHLGGLTSGGLGWTDSGNKDTIGGLSKEFYHRVWLHYENPEAWKFQTREEYTSQGRGKGTLDAERQAVWSFEPSVAERIYDQWVAEMDIKVVREARLNRETGVAKDGTRITSITTLDGTTYPGTIFLDTTYEGDLMAAAGVDYHVGREANSTYDEEHNGVQVGVLHHAHYFADPVDPYRVKGDPSSGLLPRISDKPPGEFGSGDKGVQAYCFRMCLTNAPDNRIPFPKPDGYDPAQYELAVRVFDTGWRSSFNKFDPAPNAKTDTNNHGPFSTDNIGYNYDYPDASYERRAEIIAEHETYQKGLMYFLANDERVPAEVRQEMQTWGLPKDEFIDNGNWSHQLYIREARRMIGSFVMTENELRKKKPTPDSVGMGSYTIDSHNIQRYVTPEGHVQNEGDIGVSTNGPYAIAYGALTPKASQCTNLLVPVAMSASHIAYGSIRMEPVFMILGQSAATAAAMAIDAGSSVQDVPYQALKERLIADGQILEYAIADSGVQLDGIVIDDTQAQTEGDWTHSRSAKTFVGVGYSHDGNGGKGHKAIRFATTLPESGDYEVRIAYPPNNNRATNVPVTIVRGGSDQVTVTINQRRPPAIEGITQSLGTFAFSNDQPAEVIVETGATDGFVVVDAVQWLKVE